MDVRARHWAVAMLCAVLLHCTALIAFWDPSNAGTPAVGTGGIEVSLGPAGAAPGGMVKATDVAEVAPVTPAMTEFTQPTPEEVTAEPVETVAEALPVEPAPVMDAAERVEPVTPPEPEPGADEVEPVEPVEPVQLAELVSPPEPEPVSPPEQAVMEVAPLPDIPPEKPAPPKPVAESPAPPPPEPLALPEPAETEVTEDTAPQQTVALPGDAGQSGNTKFTDSGSANATPGGGQPGGPGAYNDLLSAWLQEHHEFPERAQRRKMYGETKVSFTIDRGGNLLDYEIVASSGYKILDEAALDTLKRSSPMPPMPQELAGPIYNPTITLQFTPPH